ncbi:hypothetical protein POTOM_059381 [Populus tomentosa]|uniref:Protein NRT1/ PTR FAMILY 5.10-like n=1 Tax=Populus tomentosa TaxID=118781 RepID=A0A8X7XU40_POPTO|nr:hypothetical protein POTOM_059381 [Populus tomentosa]
MSTSNHAPELQTPLLYDIVDGSVDHKGRPVYRSNSGGWRSAGFIIGVEVAERFAYDGISSNLITYLTGPLGQSTATAAENVNMWAGTATLLPILGAFVADSFLGRYTAIIVASLIYILGLGLLTLSALLSTHTATDLPCSPPPFQLILFFFALYLVAVGESGHKPCAQAFGGDQFDGHNPQESKAKSSFFNWWYCCKSGGAMVTLLILNYIQDNLNWGLGFGIPCAAMVISLVIFLLGTRMYRYSVKVDKNSAFLRIGSVFVSSIRNWRATPSAIALEEEARGTLPRPSSEQYMFFNKALLAPNCSKEDGKACSLSDVEEAKALLRLVPIWTSCLVFAVVFAQRSTLFTKQAATMDRSISHGIDFPAASLQSFMNLSIVLFIPIYDRVFVPLARALTRKPSGITMLQRIGTGIFLSVATMVIAALVEMKRLKTAQEHGLVDLPDVTIPMSVWWLIPQYVLFGIAQSFTVVGLQEFFYDQVPSDLRSVGIALKLSIFGAGNFLSSFLISVIEKATGGNGRYSWFDNNLNRAHLDYFYWLLAGMSVVQMAFYVYSAKSYIYNRRGAV